MITIKTKKRKIIKIIISLLLLFLPVPLLIIYDQNIGFPNNTVYMIYSFITVVVCFSGFIMLGMSFINSDEDSDDVIIINGEEVIWNKLSFKEKIEKLHLVRVLFRILMIPLGLGFVLLLLEDPIGIFNIFGNTIIVRYIVAFVAVVILNIIIIKVSNKL